MKGIAIRCVALIGGWLVGVAPPVSAAAADAAAADGAAAAVAPREAEPAAAASTGAGPAHAASARAASPGTASANPAPEHAASAPAAGYSAAGLYNLGNAYARAGKPGMAVLAYQRARLLAPGDPDVDANLRFVRDSARVSPATRGAAARFAARFFGALDPTTAAWMGGAGLLLICASLLASGPGRRGLRRVCCGCGMVLVAATVGNAVVLWPLLHAAVIVTRDAPARVSPAPMSDPLFTLPEAETVQIQAEHEDFVLVQTESGRSGWVSRADAVPIVPRGPVTPAG